MTRPRQMQLALQTVSGYGTEFSAWRMPGTIRRHRSGRPRAALPPVDPVLKSSKRKEEYL